MRRVRYRTVGGDMASKEERRIVPVPPSAIKGAQECCMILVREEKV